jgi:hypothetical protein
MRLTQGEGTVILAIFATGITEMEDIRRRRMNMSTFMFELIWGDWHNAWEATGFLGELEGNS